MYVFLVFLFLLTPIVMLVTTIFSPTAEEAARSAKVGVWETYVEPSKEENEVSTSLAASLVISASHVPSFAGLIQV